MVLTIMVLVMAITVMDVDRECVYFDVVAIDIVRGITWVVCWPRSKAFCLYVTEDVCMPFAQKIFFYCPAKTMYLTAIF